MDEFLKTIVENAPYAGVVFVLLLGGFGLPLPEDIPLLAAGVLCGMEKANVWIMTPLSILAVIAGDSTMFFLGRKYGDRVSSIPILGKFITKDRIAQAEKIFEERGGLALGMARFMPVVRAAIYFSAGMLRAPYWKLLVYDGAAAVISVPFWIILAMVVTQRLGVDDWGAVMEAASHFQKTIILVVAVVLVGGVALWWARRRRRLNAQPASDAPANVPAVPGDANR